MLLEISQVLFESIDGDCVVAVIAFASRELCGGDEAVIKQRDDARADLFVEVKVAEDGRLPSQRKGDAYGSDQPHAAQCVAAEDSRIARAARQRRYYSVIGPMMCAPAFTNLAIRATTAGNP